MVSFFWFRRDLRIIDNTAFISALENSHPVIPIFIFDKNIISELPEDDPRISFIYESISKLNKTFKNNSSGIKILKGKPIDIWRKLIKEYSVHSVYFNKDYEPYAIKRDQEIKKFLESKNIKVNQYKDQLIFEENEILKNDSKAYTVFTPYKNKWLSEYSKISPLSPAKPNLENLYKFDDSFPSIKKIGFKKSSIIVKNFDLSVLPSYSKLRDYPADNASSFLSPHLRFGTISIREIVNIAYNSSKEFLNELIWREFFMQIIFHFPNVVTENFKTKYNNIKWRNNQEEFELWCNGKTGYPMVDAGMRELNSTGYMHNRVRMITAGFLCKHLLIDWRLGESYFAKKLLDFELSSNNGNWQWAAGTGCDAAPYFRIFNPVEQQKKFDQNLLYIRKWIPEYGTERYPKPIVEHKFARSRALEYYKSALSKNI